MKTDAFDVAALILIATLLGACAFLAGEIIGYRLNFTTLDSGSLGC